MRQLLYPPSMNHEEAPTRAQSRDSLHYISCTVMSSGGFAGFVCGEWGLASRVGSKSAPK